MTCATVPFSKGDERSGGVMLELAENKGFKEYEITKILNSKDEQTLIDYYTDYEIQISEKDKSKLVNQIRNSKKFNRIKSEDFSSYWKNEYEKELVNNQTIRNFSINEFYYRIITHPNNSRKLETQIDTIKNELRITDSAD